MSEADPSPSPASRPLRIVGVMPVFCHPSWQGSGVVRTATGLLCGLARRGNQVTVVSPTFDMGRRFGLPKDDRFYDGRLRLVYSTAARPTRFGTSRADLDRLLLPLLAGADLVHVHSFMSPWTDRAAALARRHGVPFVIQDHGKLTPGILENRALAKRLYLAVRGRRLLRGAVAVVPSSETVAQFLRRWDPKIRAEACTNGLDPVEFDGPAPPRPIPEPYLLSLAYLDPRKSPELLIRAYGQVADELGDWKLALVGPDTYGLGESLRALVRELGLEGRILMPGMVEGEERLAWLKNAGLFLMASTGEGLSLAMLEALACGVPCLLSPGCNYPEIRVHGAGEVVDLEPRLWAEAMRRWSGDVEALGRGGQSARRLFLERHTIDAVSAQLEDLLRRVIGRARGQAALGNAAGNAAVAASEPSTQTTSSAAR